MRSQDRRIQKIVAEFARMAGDQPKTCKLCGWITSAKVARVAKISHEKQLQNHLAYHSAGADSSK